MNFIAATNTAYNNGTTSNSLCFGACLQIWPIADAELCTYRQCYVEFQTRRNYSDFVVAHTACSTLRLLLLYLYKLRRLNTLFQCVDRNRISLFGDAEFPIANANVSQKHKLTVMAVATATGATMKYVHYRWKKEKCSNQRNGPKWNLLIATICVWRSQYNISIRCHAPPPSESECVITDHCFRVRCSYKQWIVESHLLFAKSILSLNRNVCVCVEHYKRDGTCSAVCIVLSSLNIWYKSIWCLIVLFCRRCCCCCYCSIQEISKWMCFT